jgi:hypothetical protein
MRGVAGHEAARADPLTLLDNLGFMARWDNLAIAAFVLVVILPLVKFICGKITSRCCSAWSLAACWPFPAR